MTTVEPMADRVVVQPADDAEQEMRGSLYIPDTAKEKPQQGTVIAVGPGRITDQGEELPVRLKPGDRVLYGKYAPTEVTVEGDELLILKECHVLAVIREGDDGEE